MTVYTCALLVSSLRSATDGEYAYFGSPLMQPLLRPAEGVSEESLQVKERVEVQTATGLDCTVCIEGFRARTFVSSELL
jgi:hypothetical protein